VQTSYTFEPFGAVSTSGGTTTNTIGFTAREIDGTGLYYYRMRYYHPQLARFISEDPLQLFAGDVNFYAYVRNSPIDLVDPFGLRPLTDCEKDKLKDYIPQEDLDNADITEGKVPWYTPEDKIGITRGKKIYFRAGAYNAATRGGIALLGHELVHVGQYRAGMNWLKYLWASRRGYDNNKYEIPADAKEQEILDDMAKKQLKGCEQ
jgi:RHS repeat-associated protein